MQDREREAAGESWRGTNLVFCHEDGSMYSSRGLNHRFSRMTKKAGIGHWHAHEGHVTETVDRHVIVPAIRGGPR